MPPTIIPVAASMTPPMWTQIGSISSFPPLPGNSLIDGTGFMRTVPSVPWSGDDSLRHPLWITHGITHGSRPHETVIPPSPFAGMSAEWAATVSQLIYAGLASIAGGEIQLDDIIRVRGQGVKSRPIHHLEELEWILTAHRDDPRIGSGVIEAVPYEDLVAPTRRLTAAISEGTASESDKALQRRMVRSMFRRVEESMDALRPQRPS